eukprot:6712696-Alexandrium_andersonii.AAC.1
MDLAGISLVTGCRSLRTRRSPSVPIPARRASPPPPQPLLRRRLSAQSRLRLPPTSRTASR